MGYIKKNPALVSGLVLTVLFFGFWYFQIDFLESLELKYYDVRMKLRGDADGPSDVVIVDIDNDSIAKLGRWPWPRSLIAQGIEKIGKTSPKLIGLNMILTEAERNNGLKEIGELETLFNQTLAGKTGKDGEAFLSAMHQSIERMDNDKKLASAIKNSGKVILTAFFEEKGFEVQDTANENSPLSKQSIQNVNIPPGTDCPKANEIKQPIPVLFDSAMGLGHINFRTDLDGTVRKDQPIYEYHGLYIPSYPLRIAAAALNVPIGQVKAELGSFISIGSKIIPLNRKSEFLISFKGKKGAFKSYSFFDVINDKVSPTVLTNKIVLVSPSASGILNPLITPADINMPVAEFSANTIWAILNENFISDPLWARMLEFILLVGFGAMITIVFPRLKAMHASMTFFSLLFVIITGATYLFVSKGIWIRITYPVLLLIAGYIGIISIRFFITEARKEKVEGESAETNRMLGVSFQEQGMLDMAFDKFRRVPLDNQMMGVLYNLAQDYERKRQFSKAASVYEYMAEFDDSYKDIKERKKKLTLASETLVFGDGFLSGSSSNDDLDIAGTGVRPTLGRYEIIKQLGKGAMGVVYLGRDPRINRTTAIKTVRFSEDFEPDEAKKMADTFFREAESAGTLSHPNIVTIYDAGMEKDIAYIAMEYLEGKDLDQFTKPDTLLPMRKIIDYLADIADALDYAHQKGIVHRDIKPANIMLLNSGIIKITDFGIARISASSQTMTGVIKGTPHYMSPEQFSGKKVDGRSDIFSMGTMMFRLLTGRLPFQGDNPASLMHSILNEPHPDPRSLNPKIIKPLVLILDKALEKDLEKRYQRGSVMAGHLRDLGRKIDELMSKKQVE